MAIHNNIPSPHDMGSSKDESSKDESSKGKPKPPKPPKPPPRQEKQRRAEVGEDAFTAKKGGKVVKRKKTR